MKRVFGNTGGLKASQVKRLGNFYRRRVPPEHLITFELVRDLTGLSHELRRQIGLLIDRAGKIAYVIVGNHQGIVLPNTREYRVAPGRLKGLRCIHTHLAGESLTRDDLTDLALLRLDMMAAISMDGKGLSHRIHAAHIMPGSSKSEPYRILPPLSPRNLDIGCLELIQALESELSQIDSRHAPDDGRERALIVSVTTAGSRTAKDDLAELAELVRSNGIEVIEKVLQHRRSIDSRFLMGLGKLQDLSILAMQKGATVIIFDQELNPSQIRSITDLIELKVIDRTQLILDIFAQRAQTREGKLQVELAQLKYLLPRLVTKNTAMSRLTGGIGGRGPGETKLEINRRRVYDRITRLEDELSRVIRQRRQRRAKRIKRGLAVISIIGYTNAGKSTLLNTLTKSDVLAESRLFATLDPSSRRLKFPRDTEVIVTDTVGFIKNLPADLMAAFRATLEELEGADLLLHVIDISHERFIDQIASVEKILCDLKIDRIPIIRVLNKQDLVDRETVLHVSRVFNGIAISAKDKSTLPVLIEEMECTIQAKYTHS
jgi:GTPase